MKKISLAFVLILVCAIANAQRVLKKGSYIKSSFVDQFVGTWQWQSGNDSFLIVFKKEKHHFAGPEIDMDLLKGWFRYIKNGKVVESSIENIGRDSLATASGGETEQHTLLVTFTDINTQKSKMVVMELSTDNKSAIWRTDPAYPQGVTHDSNGIPTGDRWIMHKIR